MIDASSLSVSAATLAPYDSPVGAAGVRAVADAAADAGFEGISICTAHHDWAVADGMRPEEYYELAQSRGLAVPAAEVIVDWSAGDPRSIARSAGQILDVAARSGAATVITTTLGPELPPLADAAARLGTICDLAAERGLKISYEFLPTTGVPDLASAVRLLEATDRDNLGLVLDVWHWFLQARGPDFPTLRSIASERIHLLQLNDAPEQLEDEWVVATMQRRLLPGDGVVEIERLLDALDEIGAEPALATEVFSAPLRSLGVAEHARRQRTAAASVLAARTAATARRPRPDALPDVRLN
jgi:sugar phosphate isomerase/epimerase